MQYRCQCILADTLAFARGTSSFTNNDDYITAAMQPWVYSGWTLTSTAGVDSQLLLFDFGRRHWAPCQRHTEPSILRRRRRIRPASYEP